MGNNNKKINAILILPIFKNIKNRDLLFFEKNNLASREYEAKNLVYPIVGVLICFVLTDLIHLHLFKNIFMRLRPCHEIGVCEYTRLLVDCGGYYGFVSGHAANSSALVLFLLMYFKSMHQFMKYFLIAWVLLVAYSRIYLGKHYPLDLIFGILLGCLIAFLCFRIFFYVTKSSK